MTYAESGLFWSQCFLPSLVIRKVQAGAGKSSLGLQCFDRKTLRFTCKTIMTGGVTFALRFCTSGLRHYSQYKVK